MNQPAEKFEFENSPFIKGFTKVQNVFITEYMPDAIGSYVKVYLAGLMRCFGNKTDQWASVQTIADEQNVSRDTVRRAWRYWESVGVIKRIPRFLKSPFNHSDYRTKRCIEYCYQTSNIIRFLPLKSKHDSNKEWIPYPEYLKSAHWKRVRERALVDDGHRCRLCNDNKRLNVHHRTYKNIGAEKKADVITLCRSCHSKFHDVLPGLNSDAGGDSDV